MPPTYNNSHRTIMGDLCVKGNITTREKCFVCGKSLVHDERRNGCFCPDHPQVGATTFIVRFGRDIYKRFKSYPHAAQFLNGLRFKTGEGTFDKRDYQNSKPLSFINLSEKYLNRKRNLKSFKEIRNYIRTAQKHWDHTNVKEINGADIEDYLFSIPNISEKTRANYKTSISDFWKWLLRRGVINMAQMPIMPQIKYELGYRTITDRETQGSIIDEVRRISSNNKKIWLGIDMLSVYVSMRPGDLLKIRERDIDLKYGVVIIHNPTKTKNKSKTIRLLDRHIEIIGEMMIKYPALPHMPFFRHVPGVSGVSANAPFGPKYFKKWWDKACQNLGIQGLDLYGGTRHTTTTEIARLAGADKARKATAHETNKAFDRYCQFQDDTAFEMAKLIEEKGHVVAFKKKERK